MTTRQKITTFLAAAGAGSILALTVGASGLQAQGTAPKAGATQTAKVTADDNKPVQKLVRSDQEWRHQLTITQYNVLRRQATEQAFTGALWNNHQKGTYICAGCGLPLFSSDTKFESGTGWPSFWAPLKKKYVVEQSDHSLGMERTEVECARCGGHLGHVFNDGPQPTGLRYCMNSVAMKFIPAPKPTQASKPPVVKKSKTEEK